MTFRAAIRENKCTYFDLPPSLPRPDLAVEILPISVSSPLPPVVVVATLVERLGTFLSHLSYILGAHNTPLLALCCRRGNFGFGLLLGYDVIKKLEQILEIFQLPVIFLTEAFELHRILDADSRVELG